MIQRLWSVGWDEEFRERRAHGLKIATKVFACFLGIFAAQLPPSPLASQLWLLI
jgi:hypothetical protein